MEQRHDSGRRYLYNGLVIEVHTESTQLCRKQRFPKVLLE